jgi:hypothetical protein
MSELILLSPYRVPTQSTQMLANDDVASFLNGYICLWHPAAASGATRPPIVASPYDYEQPKAGQIFAVPESPPLVLPDDWDQRVLDVGGMAFRSTPDRETTLANFKTAMSAFLERSNSLATEEHGSNTHSTSVFHQCSSVALTGSPTAKVLELPASILAPFFGIGFGFVMVEGLFEAMEHENLLATGELWQEVQSAVAALADPDADAFCRLLKLAANRLLAAREVLYPVTIHLLDLFLLDDQNPAKTSSIPSPSSGEGLGWGAWPASAEAGLSFSLIASSEVLEKLGREHPKILATIRERFQNDQADVCGGCYMEREDPLLPLESQLWNLRKGTAVARELLGKDISVFARKRFGYHPHLPMFLNSVGLHRAVALTFDDSTLPSFRSTVTNWPSPDGKQVEAFTRKPLPADDPQTFFHLAYHLCQTIRQDHSATLGLLHRGFEDSAPATPGYRDWLELSRLAPVLGHWTTMSRYLGEVMAGEHVAAPSADEFHADFLSERTQANHEHPVSEFARHMRRRRQMDTLWTLAAIYQGLTGGPALDPNPLPEAERGQAEAYATLHDRLAELEDQVETGQASAQALEEMQKILAGALAERLQARAANDTPGYMVLNQCSFTRRLALEIPLPLSPSRSGEGVGGEVAGPVKVIQPQGDKTLLVVEVPPLGFAWFPSQRAGVEGRAGSIMTPVQEGSRMRLADDGHVRNEFFEAEIDPMTGGLRGFWDYRTRMNRLGQQLVFNPGSTMLRTKEIKVISSGPALGEVVSEGSILGDQEQVLATFRQTFRAWLGRPILDIRIEIIPQQPPAGYPWHAYFGARFAWRDEKAILLRSVNGMGYVTTHTRPETPDFLELRQTRQSTFLFPGGLPFLQRHSTRMVDVILIPEGEKEQVFDLALGLDREHPIQTALGMVTPPVLVPVTKGPPHIGASGWLFHLDAPNLLLTTLRPGRPTPSLLGGEGGVRGPRPEDSITARMLECSLHGSAVEFRCARNPKRAVLVDARGETLLEATINGDAVQFEAAPGDLIHLRVDFT